MRECESCFPVNYHIITTVSNTEQLTQLCIISLKLLTMWKVAHYTHAQYNYVIRLLYLTMQMVNKIGYLCTVYRQLAFTCT